MTPAQFSVICYTPDPARREALNVGILVWDQAHLALRIDDEAVGRVVRENPWLATDALRGLENHVREQLGGGQPPGEIVPRYLANQRGFPLSFSEPRDTTLPGPDVAGLNVALDRLVQRVVRPRRRHGRGGANPVEALALRFRPWLADNAIQQNYRFEASRTGVPRVVDFYANSRANVVVDTLKLDLVNADLIRERADAEAFKIEDILTKNPVEFVVYCDVSSDDRVAEPTHDGRQVLTSVGARVVTDLDEAVARVEGALSTLAGR